ncbi:carboxypeptidase-like regulatory domain-containing protein [Paraburkholderia sp. MMS20-SJTN17]|uniref:Carboxypeptidase-like regulatory domain-containing protein n=1 Tax=Paraburkholderia translucens TaxID=2886945 RepID=A0ABS8K788_9BURK|nr:carboxypeptidase-like regulatory domain-containing protein [Paraburkholderia sp. MMS20-SJTN17]MCC8400584.1 carboxypeptidase-like regulatory domain-containing protein [Paraburkholderia sp. MMS20-SJTN17]
MKSQSFRLRASVVVLAACGSQYALAADMSTLPPAHTDGAVTYLSGGIGSDQSAAFKSAMHNYPLALEFVGTTASGNDYLADVPVTISDSHGKHLLSTRSDGPFMLVSLPSGRYDLTATYHGKTERREVSVSDATHAREMFAWPM